jgi:acetyl-CoA acyltransferase
MSEAAAIKRNIRPLGYFRDLQVAGVPPEIMGIGPVPAIRRLLSRNGLRVEDIDVFEINEAFAAQVLADIAPLGISEDKLNICGGGIALGHPIGASGARVLCTLVHQLQRTGGRRGICSLCLGGGNAVSMLIEMC